MTQDLEASLSFGLFYFQIIVGKMVGVYWAHVNATEVFQLLAFLKKIYIYIIILMFTIRNKVPMLIFFKKSEF